MDKLNTAAFLILDIAIVWIAAHKGILNNETADYLAERTVRFGNTLPNPIPYSDFFTIPCESLRSNITRRLLLKSTDKLYFELYSIPSKPWYAGASLFSAERELSPHAEFGVVTTI